MQLYAFEKNDLYINAARAIPGRNYICPECAGILRVRGGLRIQRHFYHYSPGQFCYQSGKGEVHLRVQHRLLNALPVGEAKMEVRFPEIGRIADVAWEKERIIFEVQCAQMSPEEAWARTYDYAALGWQVVWILHDGRYLQNVQSALESGLLTIPHYYTNIDRWGRGMVYDRLNVWEEGRLIAASEPREVVLERKVIERGSAPSYLKHRAEHWKTRLAADYFELWLDDKVNALWNELNEYSSRRLRRRLWEIFTRPYKLLFKALLESCCRRS